MPQTTMRILHSIRSVNLEQGGPIEAIRQIARIHEEQGHQVEICSLDGPEDPWVLDCPVKVHALGPVSTHFGYSSTFVPWLKTHARLYDAIVINGIWQYNSFGVWRGVRGKRTPYFVFPHGMLDPWFKRRYPLKHLKKWLYWPWAEYRVLRDATAVCFTCEEERRLARQSFWLYRCQERVIPFGTAALPAYREERGQLFLERFPELRGKAFLLFLGRIHPKKGCDVLLEAFAEVTARSPKTAASRDVYLLLAGPDSAGWKHHLCELTRTLRIQDRVIWPGMLTGDLKTAALHLAEAFVLPSHQENFGIAVAEALSCSLPVLISNKVNIWHEIERDEAGIVEADDREGVVRQLRRWLALSSPDQLRFRANAKRCFERHFDIKQSAQALLQAISQARDGSCPNPTVTQDSLPELSS